MVLGDVREALVLAASVLVVIAITVVQERRAERALEALRRAFQPARARRPRRPKAAHRRRRGSARRRRRCSPKATACRRTRTSTARTSSSSTSRSSPASRCRCAKLRAGRRPGRCPGDGTASVVLGSLVGAGAREVLGDRAAHAAGPDRRGAGPTLEHEATPLQRETGRLVRRGSSAGLRCRADAGAVSACAAARWRAALLSGLAARHGAACPRSSRSCLRLPRARRLADLAAPACSPAACRRSRRSARPPCCASTRPAR